MFRTIIFTLSLIATTHSAYAETAETERPHPARLTIEIESPDHTAYFDELDLSCGGNAQDLGMLITNEVSAKFFADLLGNKYGYNVKYALLNEWDRLNQITGQKTALLKIYFVETEKSKCSRAANQAPKGGGGGGGIVIQINESQPNHPYSLNKSSGGGGGIIRNSMSVNASSKGGTGGVVIIRNLMQPQSLLQESKEN